MIAVLQHLDHTVNYLERLSSNYMKLFTKNRHKMAEINYKTSHNNVLRRSLPGHGCPFMYQLKRMFAWFLIIPEENVKFKTLTSQLHWSYIALTPEYDIQQANYVTNGNKSLFPRTFSLL